MDNKPKPKRPWRKTVFSPQPHDTDLPENSYVDRKAPDKQSPVRAAGKGIPSTAPNATAARESVGGVNDKPGMMPGDKANVFSKFGDIVPYMSNIANSFRRAPLPAVPGSINPVASNKVNFDGQRVETDRSIRGANANADRSLDENTASAVKANSMAQGFRAKNEISMNEANTNAQIGNENNRVNAGIEMQNVAMMNQYKNQQVEAQVANQVNQSANLSNAADKYVGQQQFTDAQNLDREKWAAYQPVWARSGVADRTYGENSQFAQEMKVRDPEGYKRMYPEYAGGGDLKPQQTRPTADSTSIYQNRMLSDMDMQFRSSGEMKDVFGRRVTQDVNDLNRQSIKGKPGYNSNGFPVKHAAGGDLGDPVPGFRNLSGAATASPASAPGSSYPSFSMTKDDLASGWQTYPVKDPNIGWNDWRRKAFPNKENFMQIGTNFQYMINNSPNSNNYRGRYSHYSTAPVQTGKVEDKPMFAAFGGSIDPKPKPKTVEENSAHIFYPYPTAHDRKSPLYGTPSGLQTSDSAGYVSGYRSNMTPEQMYPMGFELKAPVQSGYFDKMLATKKPLPSMFPSRPIGPRAFGGNMRKVFK